MLMAVIPLSAALGGVVMARLVPNGLFVEVLPDAYRARAFGIMQGGLFIVQGVAVAAGGAVGDGLPVSTVVGGWILLGVLLMLGAAVAWPRSYETKSSSRA